MGENDTAGWPDNAGFATNPVPFRITIDGISIAGYCMKFFSGAAADCDGAYRKACDAANVYLVSNGLSDRKIVVTHLSFDDAGTTCFMGVSFGIDSATGRTNGIMP